MESLRRYSGFDPSTTLGTSRLTTSGGFSLIEILIVLAILGTLAAIVILGFRDQIAKAKEAAAKETIQNLRNVIESYAAQHKGVPPGYPNGDTSKNPNSTIFTQQLCSATNLDGAYASQGTAGYPLGPYLPAIPENPFNDKNTVKVLGNFDQFPASATGTYGWRYKPLTKTIRLSHPGKDSEGVKHYDY
ncbi:MAG: type II secretion system GspH family protein [Sedimentisphaerales bacterium]|nr:type II secretion system GspH family protein [Sedimentisphaerales bacterium]